ncbi:MAG: exodeoxyribonuclease V subunit gamma, partial [Clostridia bacterium]|nr:exodeoxyribonuclease V subunit gamma [Clostridia bacterium]
SADDLSRLYDVLCNKDFFRNSNVYFDSFTSFTSVQHKIIERIFKSANNVTVTVPVKKEELLHIDSKSVLNSVTRLLRDARNMSDPIEETIEKNDNSKSPTLQYVSKNIWNLSASPSSEISCDDSVILEICDTPYSEAEAVAAHIRTLLSEGARCRDIVVVARDAENYRGIIDQALKKSDIPFYFSNANNLYSTAAMKFIVSALKIKLYNFKKSDVISHVKTNLCNVDRRDAYLFEEYVNTWNINGASSYDEEWTMNPDGYSDRVSERAKEILAAANRVRAALFPSLQKLFIMLDASNTVDEICRAIYDYLVESKLEAKLHELSLKAIARNDLKEAQEMSRLYATIINSLADIGVALSGEKASTEEFISILKSVCDKTDVNTIPTSIDEVTIGSANTLRLSEPKYVFVLGLCEGKFPASVKDNGIFSNADKTLLFDADVSFDSNAESRASDELMYVKKCFSAPTKRLYALTHSSEINGSKCFKSLAFSRLELLSGKKGHIYSESDFDYLVSAPKNASINLRSIRDSQTKNALSKALAPHINGIDEFSAQPIKTTDCNISANPIGKTLSASSFETYVKCPFNHFCRYTLGLREKKNATFGMDNIGTFIHAVLENVIKALVPATSNDAPISDEEISRLIDETVDSYLKTVLPSQLLVSKRLSHLYLRLKKLSHLLAQNIIKEFADSDFYPAAFELRINKYDAPVAPLTFTLNSGTQIRFNGIVDRVDLYKKDSTVYVRVVDYKTGTKEFKLDDLKYGLNTQMLLYLYAICKNGKTFIKDVTNDEEITEIIPFGVTYLSSNISALKLTEYESDEAITAAAEEKLSRSGITLNDLDVLTAANHELDPAFLLGVKLSQSGTLSGKALVTSDKFKEIFTELEAVITKIADNLESGIITAKPIKSASSPCEYCTSKPICRNVQK